MKRFLIPLEGDFDLVFEAVAEDETVDAFIERVKGGLTLENLNIARDVIIESPSK